MFEGILLMGCAGAAIAADRWWKMESRWSYFAFGMLFAYGSRDFIVGLAHWMNR
jgi:hypothetical protein